MASWKKVLTHDSAVDAATGIQLVAVDSSNDAIIRLSDGTNTDDVKLVAGTGLTVTHNNAGQITLASTITQTNDTNLTQEEVEDFVGGMLDGVETGIGVSYNDTAGNINFVVADQTLQASSGGATNLKLTMSNPGADDDITLTLAGGLTVGSVSAGAATLTSANDNTQLSQVQVEDIVGAMLDGTETGISVSYDAGNNNLDFVVADQTLEASTTNTNNVTLTMSQAAGGTDTVEMVAGSNISFSSVGAGTFTIAAETTAATATALTNTTDTTTFLVLSENATGDESLHTNASGLRYNAGTETLLVKNLTVDGTTTTVDTTNLTVKDQFILLNDADAAADADAGIVIAGDTKNVAFGYHQSDDRFVFDKTGASSGMTSIGADAFFTHVHTNSAIPTDGTNGADSDFAQVGNLYVNSTNQDIYIYS